MSAVAVDSTLVNQRLADAAPARASLTLLTLNIHQGRAMFGRRLMLHELREAIRNVGADLVFLQEAVGARRDDASLAPQYEFLGDAVWGDRAYGRNAVTSGGDHGNALLSKFPLLHWHNYDVSVEPFEARGLLHGVIAVPGWPRLHVICTHLGLKGHERERQLDRLTALIAREVPADAALVVAGDFNDWQGCATPRLAQAGLAEAFFALHGRTARSFPARLPLLKLDRVYLRGLRPVAARVHGGRAWSRLSDHAALAVTVRP